MNEERIPWADNGYAVGRLIAFALRSAKPSREGEYKDLIDRYKYEEEFREAVDNVMEGLGLQILNESTESFRGGVVLGCLGQSSPFAPNLESHARNMNAEQRMALGIVHLGIMSYYYPQVEDDDDEFRSRSGTPSEIANDIRQVCETLQVRDQRHRDAGDEPPPDVRLAYEAFLALPPAPARGGFLTRNSQVGLVNHALSELYRNNYLGYDGGDGVNTRFVTLPKYRIYVRRLASHMAAQAVRAARQTMMDAQEGETHV